MSNSLPIHCKSTGESFDVPYRPNTTVYDLIKYVCTQSTALSNVNPEDYYLAIDNSDVLDNNRTVNEAHLDQPGRFTFLQICMKTRVLMQRILQTQMQLWPTPNKRAPQEARIATTTQRPTNTDRVPSSTTQQQVSETVAAASISTERDSARLTSNDHYADSEVHFLVCGGPKVGKSTLINALCGSPVAKVNSTLALDQCTRTTSFYKMDNIYFWDTPGIQQWSRLDVESYVNSSALRQAPLCMFYCASPGSFAKLKQLDMLLDECIHRQHIYCALVVTNMFANVNRRAVLDEFKALLAKYVDHSRDVREEKGVWYYGQVGLCTMVNCQEYVNDDTGRRVPQQGINELILALTKSLGGHRRLHGWLRTIEKNRKFWLDKQEELCRLAQQTA